ncbi:protein phosphatase 1 regulatory subunit 27 [Rhinolophus ferrumequinum]|nr:protein phosphatase 1 regulatory subunit 27 [Rhinolophus ferrumequinum]
MPSRTVPYSRFSPRQRRRRLLAERSVHFPNDVLFLDHIRQGDLVQVGRFIRARKVALDTIHPSGLAALHEAVLSGNLECVKLLVKYGADIHQRDETGWTPLHIACSDGYPDIARYLISLGADRDAANDDGDLPSDLIDPDFKDLVELFKGPGWTEPSPALPGLSSSLRKSSAYLPQVPGRARGGASAGQAGQDPVPGHDPRPHLWPGFFSR